MFKWRNSSFALMCLLIVTVVVVSLSLKVANKKANADDMSLEQTLKQVGKLNGRADYSGALELLIKASRKHAGNDDLKAVMQKTFMMYVQTEIMKGKDRIAKNRHDEGGYAAVAHAYQLMNETSQALEVLTAGVLENPGSVTLWSGIGVLELAKKRDAEALAVFREVLRLDAKNATALNNTAYIQSNSTDKRLLNMREALAFAEQSVKLEPNNANFLDTLAVIRYKRGEVEEAKRLIHQAILLEPDEAFYKAELKRFEKAEP